MPSGHPIPARHLWIAIAAILLVSAFYYSFILDLGFNYADDGNYAQTGYELLLGRTPQELTLTYGLLWFKAGEWLFRLFGVDYILVRLLFYACIALTNVLVFTAIARVSGRLWLATVLTAVTLAAPAFPATAFYGLCVALNAAAQMRLASRLTAASTWDVLLAGAALGITCQLRGDFGVVFLAPLVVLLVLARQPRHWSIAALGFVGASLPFLAVAVINGYGDVLLSQYLNYPAQVLQYVVSGLGGGGDAPLTMLRRPGPEDTGRFILIYGPAVVIAASAIYLAARGIGWLRAWDIERVGQSVVGFVAGIAAFPHYFIFRPDLSHVANFVPGFVILIGMIVTRLMDERPPAAVRVLASGAIAAVLALYLWIGLKNPGTGSIAGIGIRTERLQALNGVDVRVTPDEKLVIETLRDAIISNSAPGDAIVCVPYCPGLAFMTGRRMLFDEFFADDSFLVRKPDWLPEAIARTREARPPVVLIADWAIHGTERSRFPVWAASYVAAVAEMARERREMGAMTIYLVGNAPPKE